jgi:membrane associated rhomboid family serine protease
MFIASWVLSARFDIKVFDYLGLHYFKSELFKPVQVITHMFLHDITSIFHIFFNMFGLWMFGKVLESVWGSKRFFIYFIVTGIGAAIIHTLVNHIQYAQMEAAITAFQNTPTPEYFEFIAKKKFFIDSLNRDVMDAWYNSPKDPQYIDSALHTLQSRYNEFINIPTVGASGAVYGVLLAFGMLFPNTELMLIFPPIPVKAKYVVIVYGAIELFSGLTQPGSNIAHFAHLGGMLFGFFLIKYWNKQRTNFY